MAKKRKNAFSIDFFGTSELLKKIERAGGNVEKAVSRAVSDSMTAPKNDLFNFVKNEHHFAGHTEDSFEETPLEWKNGRLEYHVGFNMRNGGIAAVFLDVGTPKMTPTFFIYNTVQKNITNIRDAQQKALEEIFKELL